MKRNLAAIGSGLGTLAFLAAIPVFVVTIGGVVTGLGSLAILGYRTYRRMQSNAG